MAYNDDVSPDTERRIAAVLDKERRKAYIAGKLIGPKARGQVLAPLVRQIAEQYELERDECGPREAWDRTMKVMEGET